MMSVSSKVRSLSKKTAYSSWARMFPRGSFLNMFFEEKEIPSRIFEVTDSHGVTHSIPNDVVVEAIAQTRGSERRKIEETIRKIDFRAGDVNHYFKHLARGLAESYAGALRFSKVALNKYNPNEMLGQAINLFEDERYGLGPAGRELANRLRDVARDVEKLWRERER